AETALAPATIHDQTGRPGAAFSYRLCAFASADAGNMLLVGIPNHAADAVALAIHARGTHQHMLFVTGTRYPADLGGLQGADAKCQAAAEAVRLSGTFRALIATSASAATGRVNVYGPVVNAAGAMIASGSDALWNPQTFTAPILTELKVQVPSLLVWV